ncbi:hypothetical protein D3C75_724060 [compost metagenome]
MDVLLIRGSLVRRLKQQPQTIGHHLMSGIGGMVDVIEKLLFGDDIALLLGQPELLHHRILHADHRQVIMPANRRQPLLQVPIIHEYAEQQDHGGLLEPAQRLQRETFVADSLGLVSGVIHRKFDDHHIRLDCPIPEYIPFITDKAQLRGGAAQTRLDEADMAAVSSAEPLPELQIGFVHVALGMNRNGSRTLGNGAADIGQSNLFPTLRLFNGCLQSPGIARMH